MKITLTGYMGSGKTTIGRALAEGLDLPFFDLDDLVAQQMNMTITEAILNKGEIYFRKAEHQALKEALSKPKFVLAAGGGTPCYHNNMSLINQQSVSVYLSLNVPQIYAKLEGKQKERPLIAHLKGDALREYIAKHLLERQAFYQQATLVMPYKGEDLNAQVTNLKKILV